MNLPASSSQPDLSHPSGPGSLQDRDDRFGDCESIGESVDWFDGSVASLDSCDDYMSVSATIYKEDFFDNEKELSHKCTFEPLSPFHAKAFSHALSDETFDRSPLGSLTWVNEVRTSNAHERHSKNFAILQRLKHQTTTNCNSLVEFPSELLFECFSFLDVESLLTLRLVSHRMRSLASHNDSGWVQHCERLWRNKMHVLPMAHQKKETCAMKAFLLSYQDGTTRHEIKTDELCYDNKTGTGTVWYFRFKESAGVAWTSFDPWHAGRVCRRMIFLRDGNVMELVPTNVDSDSGEYQARHPFGDAPLHLQPIGPDGEEHGDIRMKWRYLKCPMDMASGPRGSYIRLNIGGRDVPTYIVRRSPTGNWGFVMENCWGVFATFPLPSKAESGRSLPLRLTRMRLRRTSDGGVLWLNVGGIESESEEDEEGNDLRDDSDMEVDTATIDGMLLRDSALPTTSRRQWREALLYNYGANTLPEGEAARAEFDQIFSSFRRPVQTLDYIVR